MIKKWKNPNVHTHRGKQAGTQSFLLPSTWKDQGVCFPQAGSEWLLFNYSSGTTVAKAVPTILFFSFETTCEKCPLAQCWKLMSHCWNTFLLGCCVFIFSDHSEMRLFTRTLILLLAFACCEPQYCEKTGSRNEHSLLFPVRIFCISLRSGSTVRAHNQVLCKTQQHLLKSHRSDSI